MRRGYLLSSWLDRLDRGGEHREASRQSAITQESKLAYYTFKVNNNYLFCVPAVSLTLCISAQITIIQVLITVQDPGKPGTVVTYETLAPGRKKPNSSHHQRICFYKSRWFCSTCISPTLYTLIVMLHSIKANPFLWSNQIHTCLIHTHTKQEWQGGEVHSNRKYFVSRLSSVHSDSDYIHSSQPNYVYLSGGRWWTYMKPKMQDWKESGNKTRSYRYLDPLHFNAKKRLYENRRRCDGCKQAQ